MDLLMTDKLVVPEVMGQKFAVEYQTPHQLMQKAFPGVPDWELKEFGESMNGIELYRFVKKVAQELGYGVAILNLLGERKYLTYVATPEDRYSTGVWLSTDLPVLKEHVATLVEKHKRDLWG
jgi:hypothetical protein